MENEIYHLRKRTQKLKDEFSHLETKTLRLEQGLFKNHLLEHSINYPCTNESIQAVLAGLTPYEGDTVISIAGSGDIPFAIAPYVQKVFAVDRDPEQIEFIKKQIEFLQNQDPRFFHINGLETINTKHTDVHESDLERRKEYFIDKLPLIKASLPKIELIPGQITNIIREISKKNISFNKIYLSNAFATNGLVRNYLLFQKCLTRLDPGALIYDVYKRHESDSFELYPDFEINLDRTKNAREAEEKFNPSWEWTPIVYQKIR